jgi:hypothetical protein
VISENRMIGRDNRFADRAAGVGVDPQRPDQLEHGSRASLESTSRAMAPTVQNRGKLAA